MKGLPYHLIHAIYIYHLFMSSICRHSIQITITSPGSFFAEVVLPLMCYEFLNLYVQIIHIIYIIETFIISQIFCRKP